MHDDSTAQNDVNGGHWLFGQIQVDPLPLDLDSTVMTRYGKPKGAAKGYNPNKRKLVRADSGFGEQAFLGDVNSAWKVNFARASL